MKPYIVCHMMASIDGRIDCEMTEHLGGDEYYDILEQLDCDAELSGRVTAQMHFALPEPFVPADSTPAGTPSVHKAAEAAKYAVVLDSKGRLQWPGNKIDGNPLVVLTGEQVSVSYLEALRRQGISWICAGQEEVDLPQAVELLNSHFGVKRLAVLGGGHINGAFLRAGLLDEVSLVVGAGIDGRKGMTALFDGIEPASYPVTLLKLKAVKQMGDSVWLDYSLTK